MGVQPRMAVQSLVFARRVAAFLGPAFAPSVGRGFCTQRDAAGREAVHHSPRSGALWWQSLRQWKSVGRGHDLEIFKFANRIQRSCYDIRLGLFPIARWLLRSGKTVSRRGEQGAPQGGPARDSTCLSDGSKSNESWRGRRGIGSAGRRFAGVFFRAA